MCRIIALSGIDGSGKSTCIDIINSLLHEQGANKIVIYDSMNQGVFSEMLKHISSRRGIPFRTLFSPELINIVWMSDLIYIFDQLIKPAMADNDYIILHRSELCCRVYSRLFNPCSNTIDRCLDGFSFNYDLNIFLDISCISFVISSSNLAGNILLVEAIPLVDLPFVLPPPKYLSL